MKWRVACAIIPDFAIGVRARELTKVGRMGPVALVDTTEHARIKEVNQAASQAGVNVGQTASRARARCPELYCLRWDEALLQDAVSRVSEALIEVSPAVEPIPGLFGGYWLDARGMRWRGGETGLAQSAIQRVAEGGYPGLRVGIADTLLVARAAAIRTTPKQPIRIITTGEEAAFLETLSLDEVPIDPVIRSVLRSLGLETVRELLDLPVATLTSRFGQTGEQAMLFAKGEDHRRVDALPSMSPPESVLALEEPVSETGMLIFGVRGMALELSRLLRYQAMSASKLALIFSLDDHREVTEPLSPSRPIQHGEAIFELVRDRLERNAADAFSSPVVELRLRAIEVVPTVEQQIHLGGDHWDTNALERALDRLQGRFGTAVVFEARSQNELQRECAGRWAPVLEVPLTPPQTDAVVPWREQVSPVRRCIRTPPKIHVRTDASGSPQMVRWRGDWRVIDARGPERVSGKWWQSEQHAYEDYRAVLESHEVLWLRRNALTGGWLLQGWFD